jgi:hypothetical protein
LISNFETDLDTSCDSCDAVWNRSLFYNHWLSSTKELKSNLLLYKTGFSAAVEVYTLLLQNFPEWSKKCHNSVLSLGCIASVNLGDKVRSWSVLLAVNSYVVCIISGCARGWLHWSSGYLNVVESGLILIQTDINTLSIFEVRFSYSHILLVLTL